MPDCEPDQGSVASGPADRQSCDCKNKEAFGGWAEAEWLPVMVVVTVTLVREGNEHSGGGNDRHGAKSGAKVPSPSSYIV